MFERLKEQWVYGGFLFGLVLLGLWPLLNQSLSRPGSLVLLALSVYAIHQYEEHDDNRFQRFVYETLAPRGIGLSKSELFWINVVLVWGGLGLVLWLVERHHQGWIALGSALLLVNVVAHLVQFILKRKTNPGLWSSLFLMLPLGSAMAIEACKITSAAPVVAAFLFIVAVHIFLLWRMKRPEV